jgi:hypothetical protein
VGGGGGPTHAAIVAQLRALSTVVALKVLGLSDIELTQTLNFVEQSIAALLFDSPSLTECRKNPHRAGVEHLSFRRADHLALPREA